MINLLNGRRDADNRKVAGWILMYMLWIGITEWFYEIMVLLSEFYSFNDIFILV